MSIQNTETNFKGFHLTPNNIFSKFILDINGILEDPELQTIKEKFKNGHLNALSFELLEGCSQYKAFSVRVNLKIRIIGFVEKPSGILHLIIPTKHKYPSDLDTFIKNYLDNEKIITIKEKAISALSLVDQEFVTNEAPKNAKKIAIINGKLVCFSDKQQAMLEGNVQKGIVTGIAGAGKSMIVLRLVKSHFSQNNNNHEPLKIVLITTLKELANKIKDFEDLPSNIEVIYYDELFGNAPKITSDDFYSWVKTFKKHSKKYL